tara:strand:+ start:642 stop:890 length:249 start_codon:yes stop_codon:yes gene_type:complete
MAGKNKHYFRRKAAKEFGIKNKGEPFHISEILLFLNEYKSQRGRPHLRTQTTGQQIGNILKGMKEFHCISPATWEYIGDEEE